MFQPRESGPYGGPANPRSATFCELDVRILFPDGTTDGSGVKKSVMDHYHKTGQMIVDEGQDKGFPVTMNFFFTDHVPPLPVPLFGNPSAAGPAGCLQAGLWAVANVFDGDSSRLWAYGMILPGESGLRANRATVSVDARRELIPEPTFPSDTGWDLVPVNVNGMRIDFGLLFNEDDNTKDSDFYWNTNYRIRRDSRFRGASFTGLFYITSADREYVNKTLYEDRDPFRFLRCLSVKATSEALFGTQYQFDHFQNRERFEIESDLQTNRLWLPAAKYDSPEFMPEFGGITGFLEMPTETLEVVSDSSSQSADSTVIDGKITQGGNSDRVDIRLYESRVESWYRHRINGGPYDGLIVDASDTGLIRVVDKSSVSGVASAFTLDVHGWDYSDTDPNTGPLNSKLKATPVLIRYSRSVHTNESTPGETRDSLGSGHVVSGSFTESPGMPPIQIAHDQWEGTPLFITESSMFLELGLRFIFNSEHPKGLPVYEADAGAGIGRNGGSYVTIPDPGLGPFDPYAPWGFDEVFNGAPVPSPWGEVGVPFTVVGGYMFGLHQGIARIAANQTSSTVLGESHVKTYTFPGKRIAVVGDHSIEYTSTPTNVTRCGTFTDKTETVPFAAGELWKHPATHFLSHEPLPLSVNQNASKQHPIGN
ncbi:hypothetical protein [Rosistilla oblonga]|uniref:hypothetical protein n=1 Tax=Rosistilla oblonga TaxID=2527990 RepID=UPI003A969E9E